VSFVLLEPDREAIEDPFLQELRGEERSERCERCRTTWIDPVPGPLRLSVDEPEDGWELLADGALWGPPMPALIVGHELENRLRDQGLTEFAAHPAVVADCDGEAIEAASGAAWTGPRWVALWPTGRARQLFDPRSGASIEPCPGCGRFGGEFEAPFSFGIERDGWDGSGLFQVPGFRYALLASDGAWAILRAAGVRWLRAQPLPVR
jgi:hypothetical protein